MPASNLSRGIHVFRDKHKKSFRVPKPVACLYCDTWFYSKNWAKAGYCSGCRSKRAVDRATAHDTPAKKSARQAKRRARLLGVECDNLSYADVIKEHGSDCHLCGIGIDLSLTAPHPRSKSFEHIQPVSKGGAHTLKNVKLAHLGCNIKKGNRI